MLFTELNFRSIFIGKELPYFRGFMWINWFQHQRRDPCPFADFLVEDFFEKESPNREIIRNFAKCCTDQLFDFEYMEQLATKIGWEDIVERKKRNLPRKDRFKRGDFGELLTCGLISDYFGYVIPINKLRFKITGNQTLPGSDILAFKIAEEENQKEIIELCYIEAKVRTSVRNNIAIVGHDQLLEVHNDRFPEILDFELNRLHDTNQELFEIFGDYLRSSEDSESKTSYKISLIWDSDMWREAVLVNLQENGVKLPNLEILCVRINKLGDLVNQIYDEIKCSLEDLDDE